jgi:apolipoprotein N-acyltransferase
MDSPPAAATLPVSPTPDAAADQARLAAAADRRLQLIYGAVAVSALLHFCSFHPIDLGLLAWVAMVPWLVVAAGERPRVGAAMSYCTTALYHLVGLSWIGLVSPEGWLSTTFLEGFYGIALAMLPLWALRRTGLPLALSLPVVGAGLEWLRGNTPVIRFPWLLLGQTQHDQALLIQCVDLASVYGLTALVLCVNGGIVDCLLLLRTRWRQGRDLDDGDRRRLALSALLPVALVVLALAYGGWRRAEVRQALVPGPRVLVVQPDLPQNLKDRLDAGTLARVNLELTQRAIAREPIGARLDAIVWSETMWPHPIRDQRDPEAAAAWDEYVEAMEARRPGSSAYLRNHDLQLRQLIAETQTTLLAGNHDWLLNWKDRARAEHNSVYALRPEGVVGRYDKINLVPASEYVPGKDSLLFNWLYELIRSFVPEGFVVFERGAGPVLMPAGEFKLAPNICFEISFPELLRESVLLGADAHVCPSNDGWFVRGGVGAAQETAELALARDHALFRAIETRRPVVRCVNRGVSLVIGPTGETKDDEVVYKVVKGKKEVVGVEGTFVATLETTTLRTLYLRVGDAFAIGCLLLTGVLIVAARAGKRLARDLEDGGLEPPPPAGPSLDEPPPPASEPPPAEPAPPPA